MPAFFRAWGGRNGHFTDPGRRKSGPLELKNQKFGLRTWEGTQPEGEQKA